MTGSATAELRSPGTASGPRRAAGTRTAGALLLLAALVGAATVVQPLLGAAVAGGLALVVVAARDLQAALLLWVPVLFLEALPAFNLAGKAGGAVLLVAWVLRVHRDPGPVRRLVRAAPWAFGALLLLLTWLTLSVTWAEDGPRALAELVRWLAVAALLLVVATTVHDATGVRRLAGSFCVGGVLSALVSLASSGNGPEQTGRVSRLGSAAGDPNFLGAWLLTALVLALVLLAGTHSLVTRAVLTVAIVLLASSIALTLSRGAFVAGVVTALAALAVLRGRRAPVLVLLLSAVLAAAVWLHSSPAAFARLSAEEGGSGRQDLWAVAWRMSVENPVTGVGLDNFTVLAHEYMRLVGPLPASYLIVRPQPDEVHNVYLQILAEAGPPALLLLLAFAGGCLLLTLRAARTFDALGVRRNATLAYGVLLAQCSLLSAAVFLSSAVDKRLWLALALGPALAASGARGRPGAP